MSEAATPPQGAPEQRGDFMLLPPMLPTFGAPGLIQQLPEEFLVTRRPVAVSTEPVGHTIDTRLIGRVPGRARRRMRVAQEGLEHYIPPSEEEFAGEEAAEVAPTPRRPARVKARTQSRSTPPHHSTPPSRSTLPSRGEVHRSLVAPLMRPAPSAPDVPSQGTPEVIPGEVIAPPMPPSIFPGVGDSSPVVRRRGGGVARSAESRASEALGTRPEAPDQDITPTSPSVIEPTDADPVETRVETQPFHARQGTALAATQPPLQRRRSRGRVTTPITEDDDDEQIPPAIRRMLEVMDELPDQGEPNQTVVPSTSGPTVPSDGTSVSGRPRSADQVEVALPPGVGLLGSSEAVTSKPEADVRAPALSPESPALSGAAGVSSNVGTAGAGPDSGVRRSAPAESEDAAGERVRARVSEGPAPSGVELSGATVDSSDVSAAGAGPDSGVRRSGAAESGADVGVRARAQAASAIGDSPDLSPELAVLRAPGALAGERLTPPSIEPSPPVASEGTPAREAAATSLRATTKGTSLSSTIPAAGSKDTAQPVRPVLSGRTGIQRRARSRPAPGGSARATESTGLAGISGTPTPRVAGPRQVQVPEQVKRALRGSVGEPPTHVTVHEGAQAAEMTGAVNAEAFTRDGQIYLAADAPLDSARGQELLAHELTHVMQQSGRSATMPGEHTREGRDLEASALAVERAMAAGSFDTIAPKALARSAKESDDVELHHRVDRRSPSSSIPSSWTPSSSTPSREGSFAAMPQTFGMPMQQQPASDPEIQRRERDLRQSSLSRGIGAVASALETSLVSSIEQEVLGPPPATKDKDSRDKRLERQAADLYPFIRARLRAELVRDRERRGRISRDWG